ncbi:MAG: hypothetical protein KC917_20930, partial [Candidatus Omnitrophica bacterium]|nr:hypothetical protein [Candidatus Omnitrophota bacterium]
MDRSALDDIKKGFGVSVLDPHGTLVEGLLHKIPDKDIDRVIYLTWKDDGWVPLWNPLVVPPGVKASRVVDEILSAFQGVIGSSWGNRLEHLLRMGLRALCEIGSASFLDLYRLLDSNPKSSNAVRERIRREIKDRDLRHFWDVGVRDYGRQDFTPCIHVLSKLILTGECPSKTFSN